MTVRGREHRWGRHGLSTSGAFAVIDGEVLLADVSDLRTAAPAVDRSVGMALPQGSRLLPLGSNWRAGLGEHVLGARVHPLRCLRVYRAESFGRQP